MLALVRSAISPSVVASLRCVRTLSTTKSNVLEVEDSAEYENYLSAAADADQLTVVDFTATWCGPCRTIGPILDSLSLDYPQVKFLKVDIDKQTLGQIVAKSRISGVPTFEFIKNKTIVDRIIGADKNKLQTLVEDLSK